MGGGGNSQSIVLDEFVFDAEEHCSWEEEIQGEEGPPDESPSQAPVWEGTGKMKCRPSFKERLARKDG